ncbi:hypothetical protein PROSTU_00130 [Providencia stuartii ATCC 25827]|uniref:Uncharacterized protein n=1 Tax=Providencia stuartii ATCC 25827 TaxID=471874 RepID=A0AA86YNU0_PROST|nr:hypothetical protein PROSTU_00532 [Providencia stuartii ATCC 25827]EDU61847.1 hypothetical protein PROSTU_00130 [Providencia stuartii ATCC 25827]
MKSIQRTLSHQLNPLTFIYRMSRFQTPCSRQNYSINNAFIVLGNDYLP